MDSRRVFLCVSAIVFAASAAMTIATGASMSAMGEMPMPGGWTMSHMWMPSPTQSWSGAAASFVGMWVVMMVAMMLPSLIPTLLSYRESVGRAGAARPDWLTALVGVGYFAVWTAFGLSIFPLGVAVAEVAMREPELSRTVPIVIGVAVLMAGVVQQTGWKARHLAFCREAAGGHLTPHAGVGAAWQHGLHLGLRCTQSCIGLTVVVLALGMMDLRVMAVVGAAITAERLAPNGRRVSRAIGVVGVAVGLLAIARVSCVSRIGMGTSPPSDQARTAMLADNVVDRLASLPLFEPVPRSELEWLVARGAVVRLAQDEMLRDIGAPIDDMWVVLDGRVCAHVRTAGGAALRKFFEVGAGFVLGVMPYSRLKTSPVRVLIEDEATLFALSRSHFPALLRDCPELASVLVHHLLDRSRDFRTAQLHDERMQSLGRLAAGLAHELNNPASGATSHARSLGRLLDELEAASMALSRARLTDDQLDVVDGLRRMCVDVAPARSAIEAADREEEFSEWLLDHGLDSQAASGLAAANVSLSALDRLAEALPPDALGVAIRWAAGDAAARQAAAHIMTATARIHTFVTAVKGFTFMDREGVPEAVDIARGLADTVAMLENKSRPKAVRVRIETATDLPNVHAFGSELNQVWEKLIDNAIDAAPAGGNVTVTATRRGDSVVVRVMDDGPGIPEEHRARIFDPFFTTKPVGSPGLGLDIARRFAQLNGGELDFSSQPGHTVFRVRLPVAGTKA